MPTRPATNRLMTIARARMMPSRKSPCINHATTAPITPVTMPLPTPTIKFLTSALRELLHVSSPSAMPRMITVRVCVAALPPIPATMGMNTASPIHAPIVSWKMPTTAAARNAVARLTISHGIRLRSDSLAGVNTRSSLDTPASR